MELIERYLQLRDECKRGTPEHAAYYCIVLALQNITVETKCAALEHYSEQAQHAIEENDRRQWNRREGYKGYCNQKIDLYQQAIDAVQTEKRNASIEIYGEWIATRKGEETEAVAWLERRGISLEEANAYLGPSINPVEVCLLSVTIDSESGHKR